MPGKKSVSKVEKRQTVKEKTAKKEAKFEKTIGALDLPNVNESELMNHLSKIKAITPAELAIQFNIKVSSAKKLLETLKENQIISLVAKSHNLKVYALKQS
ncbi:hypothetical protein KEJ21_01985 [Candidatus Bathyarchaeota archaeon]|nr:hypothetical protein [Candidatus Bathyarchaeota archaeon]MBS7630531.1 hypothetical protein [Candidatus Bathyarchaeota archaeon]